MRGLALVALLVAAPAAAGDTFLMGGLGGSDYIGELSPFAVFALEHHAQRVEARTLVSLADKYTGAGWLARGDLDGRLWGPLWLGVGFSHRDGGSFARRVWWARVAARVGPLRAFLEAAPGSDHGEIRLGLQLRVLAIRVGARRFFVVEQRVDFLDHSRARAIGQGVGAAILVGLAWMGGHV